MTLSFDVEDFKVTPYVNGQYAWLALDDHKSNQGVYISMYFRSVDEIDMFIVQLEALKVARESVVGP